MPQDLSQIIAQAVARAPDWIKKELASSDAAHRARAEDAMAAIVAAALTDPRMMGSSGQTSRQLSPERNDQGSPLLGK